MKEGKFDRLQTTKMPCVNTPAKYAGLDGMSITPTALPQVTRPGHACTALPIVAQRNWKLRPKANCANGG